ncbi:MAG: hypothetical protein WDM89_01580 [Rhizomicrobium sp.]
MSQADPSVRYASGVLAPDLGNSSIIGSFIKVPVYIALSPSQDATIAPLISTHGGEVVQGEYRERWQNGGNVVPRRRRIQSRRRHFRTSGPDLQRLVRIGAHSDRQSLGYGLRRAADVGRDFSQALRHLPSGPAYK